MTSKQMVRACITHGISLVFQRDDKLWYAGDCDGPFKDYPLHVDPRSPHARTGGQVHVSADPRNAVQDYCDARNLRWDR